MPRLDEHPTVLRYREKQQSLKPLSPPPRMNAATLRQMCLDLGADDAGFVEISRTELDGQREDILKTFPWTRSLIGLAGRINRENLRSPARSIATLELHQASDRLDGAAYKLTSALERVGVRAVTPPVGFPMEMDNWLGKMFVVSHKPVAVAAGLGAMGLHRNVIHPVFGSHVLLNTVLIDAELDEYNKPLDYNPCLECRLCAAACPTGAVGPDGFFNPVNCLTHSYRELVGGFTNWAENVADSRDAVDYRRKVSDAESVSLWQSLAYGPCYKSVYCLAVCPAGDDVVPQYLTDKKQYIEDVVRPLQKKEEPVYVLPGSDAENYVQRTFPNKKIRLVGNGVRPPSIASFLELMPRAFQRHHSEGLDATYHFTFTGDEEAMATVTIKKKIIEVTPGHTGTADVRVSADAQTWLRVLHKESSMIKEIIFRKIRVHGPMKLFQAFGRCFA